jgi:hypothetical protein
MPVKSRLTKRKDNKKLPWSEIDKGKGDASREIRFEDADFSQKAPPERLLAVPSITFLNLHKVVRRDRRFRNSHVPDTNLVPSWPELLRCVPWRIIPGWRLL